MEGARVVDKAARDCGRLFYRLAEHDLKIGIPARDCESMLVASALRMGGAGTAWPLHLLVSVGHGSC